MLVIIVAIKLTVKSYTYVVHIVEHNYPKLPNSWPPPDISKKHFFLN